MSKRPTHKSASAAQQLGKVSHEQAQTSANEVYARSTDLEVLVRLKLYKKAVEPLNKLQIHLNKVRRHVAANLKSKDRPLHWDGWSENSWLSGFFWGAVVCALAAFIFYFLYLAPQPLISPAKQARPASSSPSAR
jgi:hypothetical protein